MRPSLVEEDAKAILEEAFALIDACDGFTSEGTSSSDGAALGRGDQIEDASLLIIARGRNPIPQRNACTSTLKKKRVRRPETSSTAFQRRKKAELVALRAEVVELETHLYGLQETSQQRWDQYLKRKRSEGDTASGHQAVSFDWCEEAVNQYRRRLASELRNRKLQEMFANQTRVSGDLRAVLHQRDVLNVGIIRFEVVVFGWGSWFLTLCIDS
ncbi:hypothetical protein PHYPSEUDO_010692 [Phytophthora pseudosyringae]|uniref:Uncharacterized protein n=1 Tax=Phytophthora pseudosyringae TaxID=221518 RepID=A0A8T1VD27_9STRA|nr:hypothetical protein PHYPSEUDO_010692 [Phytophthora pseudosyringae]